MANFFLCLFIFRIVLPIVLGACIIFRPSLLSAIYLLFLLFLPCIPIPTASSMAGSTGIYIKLLIATSILTFVAQLAFQIVLLAMPPYGHILEKCELLEQILRHVGLVRLDAMNPIAVVTWISPEIVMVVISVGTYVICKKLLEKRTVEVVENEENLPQKAKANRKQFNLFVAVGKYAVLVALCVAAVLRPSVPGGLYFLVFLCAATWWSCCKELGKGFAIVMRCVMAVVVVHMGALYTYQFQWPQEYLDKNSTYARYFGLTPIFWSNCTDDPRTFNWEQEEWATYANPIALFLLYYVLALESKFLLKPQIPRTEYAISEHTPLIGGVSPSRRYGSGKKPPVYQDSTGSFTITGENPEDIPMDELGKGAAEEEYKPTIIENVMYGLESILQVIIKSSYIVTNIIMMAWSITYISWITFVLLIWANLLWLVPNQRKSMLRSSPFLVAYAWFLLISAYIYSMNLTESELPTTIEGIDLSEIGFQKVEVLPCNPLLVKCLFTAMFWITLRQFVRERIEERQTTALADMAAPLQVTVGAAAGVENEQDPGSKLMEKIGQYLRKILTKFWIWVVAITLFAVAITGERMTAFRIFYMALFLFFILTFQISFRAWRKMMFGFWLTVIVFSMAILVMVYTYQFKNFDIYWRDYLHVPIQRQLDIGLEKFETKQLFVRLVTPTFFVIITVIQLHYFHKEFMELSDPKNTSVIGVDLDQSSLQGGAPTSDKDETSSSIKMDLTDTDSSQTRWQRLVKYFHHTSNLIFLFLELHMPKFVVLFLMLVCIYDKCALYFILVLLLVLACAFGRPMQIFAIYTSSVFVSVMLLARMIYQTDYINPGNWNVTCEMQNNSKIANNAKWLGFYKTSKDASLPHLVKWNIMYILVVTLWAVILVRQFNYRVSRGKPTTRAFFMFPKITRWDADKSTSNCIKYLFNYGFFKFGVEICLMATVAVIGFRMDMYSIIYSVWLCVMFIAKRDTLAKIWTFYMMFIALLLPIQYVMTVGLPPTLCILFPWDQDYWDKSEVKNAAIFRRLQEFSYLLDTEYPPSPKKLICDFILLLLVSRQAVIFRIEKRWAGREYPGGSNDIIIHHAEEKGFVNPTPDYISSVRSYLDVIKKGVYSSFLWITLAIVFLAGTNRVNVFSIGYLIGAFVFLWQGTDLYLRPIPTIIKSWDLFLGYNVFVILCKTALQIVGCIFIQDIPNYACWLIQLFGIGCVKKFGDLTVQAGLADELVCKVPREYVGLVWDGLCFGFMIMQRRIFTSYNFFHLINEIKAGSILASRGAELIEELRLKRMTEQEEQERRVLEKIKAKMDRIKANQQKIQGSSYKDSENHYVDTIFKGRPKRRTREPKSYKQAVRSGDYYMFDDLDDEDELDFMDIPKDDEEEAKGRGQTVSELLSTAMKTDISTSVKRSETDFRRRGSMPLPTRQKSIISTRSQLSAPYSAPPIIEEPGPRTVTIIDERGKDEPKPGTSKDDDESTVISEQKPTVREKVSVGLLFVWAFIQSSMISLTNFLNKYSRDYRYVIRVLAKEKKFLKEHTDYNVGLRLGSGQLWQPAASYNSLLGQSHEDSVLPTPSCGTFSPSDSYRLVSNSDRPSLDRRDYDEKPPVSDESDQKAMATLPYTSDQDRRKASVLTVPEIRILAPSLERGLDSPSTPSREGSRIDMEEYEGTEMSSYDQPPIIRLLLAIWYIIMSRSENVCYFIIFLNQIKSATFLSLPLPLMVFLWGTLTIPRPDKTFWVTIIAYTEVIVLIKCMFQFDIIPWNMSQGITNNPFYPPRIIGIERNSNFAVWDLLLLLVVFFHRFMLKSMGLWKSSPVPAVLLTEGDYKVNSEGKLEPVQSEMQITRRSSKHSDKTLSSKSSVPEDSDLERLVEESDQNEDDMRRASITKQDLQDKILSVECQRVDPMAHLPQSLKLAFLKYGESIRLFFKQLRDPTSRVAADVYSYMFLCDFYNFFVILIGYSSFGTQQGDGGVSSYLEDDRVPVLFLLMLILQFTLIIVDRGIFLRKNILAKIIFQFIQVFVLHIWLFIVFPIITERGFNSVLAPQMYYMVKCFYLLLSAYQIRCGYPTRILGNFLCKGYNYVNMFLFKGFMAIPFLFELRTVMDWMWTDTSMTVFDWIKMEDIFSHIFQIKCTRHVESEYPQPRGERKPPVIKYLMGGAILALIIAIIWFPLVFFSLGNAVGKPNPPYDVTLEIRIGPYEPVYQMSAQSNSIHQFTESNLAQLQQAYIQQKTAATFISNYEGPDIAAVKLSLDSANIWSISPPDRERMVAEVSSNDSLKIRLEYKVSHKTSKPEDSGVIPDNVEIQVPAAINGKPNVMRQNLLQMLKGNKSASPMILEDILPKFLKVTNRGTAKSISQLMFLNNEDAESPNPVGKAFRTISLSLDSSNDSVTEWWQIKENCTDLNYKMFLKKLPMADCNSIIVYTFNDKIFPSTLSVLTGGGIIGLYSTLVFVAFRFFRGFFAEQCFKIMFEDMPNIDRVLQLCLDIYLVREAGEFALEEDLFAKLVFLFRSPETMIKWTRPKEELADDEDPEGDA
ncbi:piezo-type mechanosensitive ion channel component isoform X11 [Tribolium castaneum]|uniref:piezo-type mechanosensitive ion channel component isoform X11 n=1 Tax=Tribolium castaneum TaxID=7070 RepID=UPI00077DB597|nr:PREDICTED: piezo-type mechanosensitive ion channel component isoform X10 [Tribolium castaneum]|eukprot:XP_015835793.1 PREDICTED: piezo-type mechanosensitive ion channel component isoform X10 [Tribolium castaneum]